MINNNNYKGIKRIHRNKNMSNMEFFNYLINKLGYTDLEICHNYYIKNQKMFAKWVKSIDILQYEPEEYIKSLHAKRDEFINKATHRSVLDIEIMIDIDEAGNHKSIKEKAKDICKRLIKDNIAFTCSFSGSKSYHISILVPELRNKSKTFVYNFKNKILSNYIKSDTLKSSYRNMIALEGVNHWKTGKIKKEVISYE